MEHYSENLVPYLIGLENELQTNPGKLTLDTIQQTQERLHSITQHLNNIRNSYLAVNKVNPDILYNIFTVAIYGSDCPDATVLAISYVCRHWRKFVLGWPALWAFVNLRHSGSIVDLFISRSENTPLVLSWKGPAHYRNISLKSSYLESRANLMLSRLCSLTLHLSSSVFLQIQPAFQNSQLQPLQLRYMDIQVPPYESSRMPPLMDILRIDTSYLRRLELRGVDLPWQVLPETKLTHLTFFPINLPPLSQLVAILASCPLLRELEFEICGGSNAESEARLDSLVYLHSLERLVLVSKNTTGVASLEYLRQLLDCIQTSKSLSQFELFYSEQQLWDSGYEALSFNILRPVPPSILSHFADHHYLSISITLFPSDLGYFQILSAPEYPDDQISWSRLSYPLCLSGPCPPTRLFDRSPILDLIYAFPAITHLTLGCQAREILSSWDIDFRGAFPYLKTLNLFGATDWNADDYFTDVLNSLPVGLKLKTFTIGDIGVISPKVVLDVTSKMTTLEVLKLDGRYYYDCQKAFEEVIAVLGERGVMTLPLDRYFADIY